MILNWQNYKPCRPDRYNDWEKKIRTSDPDDGWCGVSVVVLRGNDLNQTLKKLKTLEIIIDKGGDIAASNDEAVKLKNLIGRMDESKEIEPYEPTNADLNYYLYMPESRIYTANGDYNGHGLYEIVFAGPPVPGLVNDKNLRDQREPTLRPEPGASSRVIVAVIDDGIAFANQRFRKMEANGLTRSRLTAIWLQNVESFNQNRRVALGELLNECDLNKLINKADFDEQQVYRVKAQAAFGTGERNLLTQRMPLTRRISHGTHVMDLAIGRDMSEVSSEFEILAFQVPSHLIGQTAPTSIASYVLQAVRAAIVLADQRDPNAWLIINISFGNFAGPKDGYGLIESEIARLIELRELNDGSDASHKTVVILPAGNTYDQRVTARMDLPAKSGNSVDWYLSPDDQTPNFVEIWMPEGHLERSEKYPLAVTITLPGGKVTTLSVDDPDGGAKLLCDGSKPIACVYFDRVGRNDDRTRRRIIIAVNPTATFDPDLAIAPAGYWNLSLTNLTDVDTKTHLYIQRGDTPAGMYPRGRQSYFEAANGCEWDPNTGNYDGIEEGEGPLTNQSSLSAFGNGDFAILVGASQIDGQPSPYTSSGPTAGRCDGPDLSVIVDDTRVHPDTFAAGTLSGTKVRLSGTSVAAPQATRRIAEAISAGELTSLDPREISRHLRKRGTPAKCDRQRQGKFVLSRQAGDFLHRQRRHPSHR